MIPPSPPLLPQQSALTTAELTLKDGLRALGLNVQLGAHWLVEDVGPKLAQQIDPDGITGRREKLHALVDSAARGTLSTLVTVLQGASAKAMADEPYRSLDFTLLPLADYFSGANRGNPSGLFAEVFYWLLRHSLAARTDAHARHAMVHQLAVDEAFWIVQSAQAGLAQRLDANTATDIDLAQDHAALCALLLRALVTTEPVRDTTLLPWAHADANTEPVPELLQVVLVAVLAVGCVTASGGNLSWAADGLRLGQQIAMARRASFAAALAQGAHDDGAALSAEFKFIFRHI